MNQITYHMHLDIKDALMHWGKRDKKLLLKSLRRKDGLFFNKIEELDDAFLKCIEDGILCVPIGKCDNFDIKTGCKGHEKSEANDEPKA